MAEKFQVEVCGGIWWNPSRNIFGSSPCSSGINPTGDFGWPSHELPYMNASSSEESGSPNSDGSIGVHDMQVKPNQVDSAMDSSSEIMGVGLSSSTACDWTGPLFHGIESSEANYSLVLQEEEQNFSMNYGQENRVDCSQIQIDQTLTNFSTITEDSSINTLEPADQDIPSNHKPFDSLPKPTNSQGIYTSTLPSSSVSYDYGQPLDSSNLLQTFFETDPQAQDSLCDGKAMKYPTSHQTTLDEFSTSSLIMVANSSFQKHNTTNPWNMSAVALNGQFASEPKFVPCIQNHGKLDLLPDHKAMIKNGEVQGLISGVEKISSEPIFKRPRFGTPTSLPTFKVRKEKLGDRVTALQQLVSPFGKTDTASVLHEAIEYIKFLHNQISVLISAYLKNGVPIQSLQSCDKTKEQQEQKRDLKSQGLCLVPVSSTCPVVAENTTDFWTPTFIGTLR